MIRSADGDTDCDIFAGVLQRDALAPYLFMISLDYVLQMSVYKRKWLHIEKGRK